MNVLLHSCCAPCTIFPYSLLKKLGNDVTAFFFNPNIHPYLEFKKRHETLNQYADHIGLPLIVEKQYGLREFLKKTIFLEKGRCAVCYQMRLEKTVFLAKSLGFEAFTTTLLYSKYQRHDLIVSLCKKLSGEHKIPFLYHDFREGWQLGVESSLELGMYRQKYCGCIFSEQERYDKSLKN